MGTFLTIASSAPPEQIVDALFELYDQHGHSYYDDTVTQTEHALQTAALAEAEHASQPLVAAALLHDIGHLLLDEHAARPHFLGSDRAHQRVGALTLRRWFPPSVTTPIALHVPAKRYLVTTDPNYAAGLSPASTRSLAVQGGPMSPTEASTFARQRYAHDACRLRRWDDNAKVAGRTTPELKSYRAALLAQLDTHEN
jgi:phosphonate degradation associated HDIG domain protein